VKDDRLYLIHIMESIERVEEYTSEGLEHFLADTKTQDAVLRNLQTLSESTQRISPELKNTHKEVDWRGIAGFRNVLVHEYLGVNLITIWGIIEGPLKDLKEIIRAILESIPEPNH
jgi:uncharacterized protein with HEPN domain